MNVCQYCYIAQSFRASRLRGAHPPPAPTPFLCPPFLNSWIRPCEGQRCFVTTVCLIGTRCALCIAHSKGHWLSGSLLWDSKSISGAEGLISARSMRTAVYKGILISGLVLVCIIFSYTSGGLDISPQTSQ